MINPDYVAARELVQKQYGHFPANVLGALDNYINSSERYLGNPSDENLEKANGAVKALEQFCLMSNEVRDAHTLLMNFVF